MSNSMVLKVGSPDWEHEHHLGTGQTCRSSDFIPDLLNQKPGGGAQLDACDRVEDHYPKFLRRVGGVGGGRIGPVQGEFRSSRFCLCYSLLAIVTF